MFHNLWKISNTKKGVLPKHRQHMRFTSGNACKFGTNLHYEQLLHQKNVRGLQPAKPSLVSVQQ